MHRKFIGLNIYDDLGKQHTIDCQTYSNADNYLYCYSSKYGEGVFNLNHVIGYNEIWSESEELIKCENCKHYYKSYLNALSDSPILNLGCKLHNQSFNNQKDKSHQCDDYLEIGTGRNK